VSDKISMRGQMPPQGAAQKKKKPARLRSNGSARRRRDGRLPEKRRVRGEKTAMRSRRRNNENMCAEKKISIDGKKDLFFNIAKRARKKLIVAGEGGAPSPGIGAEKSGAAGRAEKTSLRPRAWPIIRDEGIGFHVSKTGH